MNLQKLLEQLADSIQSYDWWPCKEQEVREEMRIQDGGYEVAGLFTSNYYPAPPGRCAMILLASGKEGVYLQTLNLHPDDQSTVRGLLISLLEKEGVKLWENRVVTKAHLK